VYTDFNIPPVDIPIDAYYPGFDHKPIISEMFTAFFGRSANNRILFRKNQELHSMGIFETRHLGRDFENYIFWKGSGSDFFAAVNSRNRLVAFIGSEGHVSAGFGSYPVWADISVAPTTLNVDVGYFRIPEMENVGIIPRHIFSFQDRFYISFDRNLPFGRFYVEIVENGEFEVFDSPLLRASINNFFEFQNHLFARFTNRALMVSADGRNWQHFGYSETFMGELKEIEGFLVFFRYDQIFMLGGDIYDVNNMMFYQLPKKNMEGYHITSVNKFNDYLVVTTHRGLFYKQWSDLINDKKIIQTFN